LHLIFERNDSIELVPILPFKFWQKMA